MAVEPDSGDDENSGDEAMTASSSSAVITKTVPDDVEFPCGCHFHWFAILGLKMTSTCN